MRAGSIRSADEGVPGVVSDDIHWIVVSTEYRRRTRVASFATLAAMLVLGVAVVLLAFAIPSPLVPGLPAAIATAVLGTAVAVYVILFMRMRQAFRIRLGTDGRDFLLDLGDGDLERYSMGSLVTGDGRQLLAGRRLIPLCGPIGWIFDAEEIRGHVIARMTLSSRVGILPLLRLALHRGNRELWFIVIVSLAAMVVVMVLALFSGFAVPLRSGEISKLASAANPAPSRPSPAIAGSRPAA